MADFENQISSILSNPQMMQQIMSIAGSLGQQQSAPAPAPQPVQQTPFSFDPGAMQGMMELLRGTQLDKRQQDLLSALGAYLPQNKVIRLRKAMQASKVARYASTALNRQQTGR